MYVFLICRLLRSYGRFVLVIFFFVKFIHYSKVFRRTVQFVPPPSPIRKELNSELKVFCAKSYPFSEEFNRAMGTVDTNAVIRFFFFLFFSEQQDRKFL